MRVTPVTWNALQASSGNRAAAETMASVSAAFRCLRRRLLAEDPLGEFLQGFVFDLADAFAGEAH